MDRFKVAEEKRWGEAREDSGGRGRRGVEEGEFDVVASETGFGEDATHDRVVEDRENEVFEFDFEQRRRLSLMLHHLHKVEAVRVATLVGLGALDGSHQGV